MLPLRFIVISVRKDRSSGGLIGNSAADGDAFALQAFDVSSADGVE